MDFYLLLKTWAKVKANKYGQKLLDSTKKSTTGVMKTASKRAILKTAEVTGDLIDNKIADKIKSVSKKKSAKELHNNNDKTKEKEEDAKMTKKRYISPEERQQIIDELRLVSKTHV